MGTRQLGSVLSHSQAPMRATSRQMELTYFGNVTDLAEGPLGDWVATLLRPNPQPSKRTRWEERLGVLRVRQALQVGAQAIATACPFCTVMLEDARRALGIEEDELQVLDVAELLGRAVLG